MTAPHNGIAKYATQPICASGAPSIAIYRQKLKNAQTLGRMLMCTLDVGLFNENLAKRVANQKQKSTMKITINRLKLFGCAVSAT